MIQKLDIRDCEELDLWEVRDDDGDDGEEGIGNNVGSSAWQYLKSLCSLRLERISKLESLPSCIGGFTALQELEIVCLENLKTLPESMGNLTHLNRLYINNCQKLEALPKSFGNLSALQSLDIWNCPQLEIRCKTDGDDWPLIQHIPSVYINGRSVRSNYMQYASNPHF